MPFGLDVKSLVVGMLLAYFAIPWIMGMINRPSTSKAAA
jgi:antibiotic biosynthesis monooxygenase (ABM) superfamily enzyme